MKTIILFLALCVSVFAATPAQVNAWKAKAPTPATANPVIKQLVADCGWLAKQATPENVARTASMMKSKAESANQTALEKLRSINKSSKNTQVRREAEEVTHWVTTALLPFISQGEALGAR